MAGGRRLDGAFSICRVEFDDNSDAAILRTVKWGYDTREQAVSALRQVAEEEGIPLDELVVIETVMSGAELD